MAQVSASQGRRKAAQQSKEAPFRRIVLTDRKPSLVLRLRRGQQSLLFIECLARKKKARSSITVDLQPRSSLTVVFFWRGKASVHIAQKFRVGQGARLHLLNITRGPCVHEAVSEVAGAHGESRIDWIVHARDAMECRLSARNVFGRKDGRGDLSFRGVAEGSARMYCNGAVDIGPKAAGTQAHLTERILLLGSKAKAESVPSMDVRTHDVVAGHSASISRLHPEDLFYFQSRGITQKRARVLAIEGFLGNMIDEIADESMRKAVRKECGFAQ